MRTMTRKGSMVILMISSLLLISLDQVTKFAVQKTLMGKTGISLIKGVFELQYLENRGSAFGMMQGKRVLFLVMAGLMLVIIPYIYSVIPLTRRFLYLRVIAILFLSGAIGNAIDRMVHGYVIDFFYFSLIDFPIFNVADIYVTVAACLLIILTMFYYKDEDFEQIHVFQNRKLLK